MSIFSQAESSREAGVTRPAELPADETLLIERARRDPAAFGQLYERHYDAILNYLYRRTLSVTVAEELTSNTFFKALRGMGGFQLRPAAHFRSWLYAIATNEVRMFWRNRKGRPAAAPLSQEADPERVFFSWPPIENPEQAREKLRQFASLHRALLLTPEPYQTVLTLRYFESLTNEEVAEVLGKRLNTVKSLVRRGLAKLTVCLRETDATFPDRPHSMGRGGSES
jgi:RNA polymerase sigma-70 factor, ECF subfamily